MIARLFASVAMLLVSVGCRTTSADAARATRPAVARFFLETTDARASTLVLPRSGARISVSSHPVLTEGDFANVAIADVDLGRCLAFQVNSATTRDLYRLTGAHQGRRIVLTVNDQPVGARRIDGPLADGVLFVFVEMPDEALPRLVEDLKRTTLHVQRESARKR